MTLLLISDWMKVVPSELSTLKETSRKLEMLLTLSFLGIRQKYPSPAVSNRESKSIVRLCYKQTRFLR